MHSERGARNPGHESDSPIVLFKGGRLSARNPTRPGARKGWNVVDKHDLKSALETAGDDSSKEHTSLNSGNGEKGMFIVVSPMNPDPMYKQVTDQIKHAIAAGDLAPETRLPSIREMSRELRISAITIKRAYADLEH